MLKIWERRQENNERVNFPFGKTLSIVIAWPPTIIEHAAIAHSLGWTSLAAHAPRSPGRLASCRHVLPCRADANQAVYDWHILMRLSLSQTGSLNDTSVRPSVPLSLSISRGRGAPLCVTDRPTDQLGWPGPTGRVVYVN